MAVDQTLLNTYASYLIAQYRTNQTMIDTVKCLANCALCDGLPQQLQECFDLETAVGAQLTIIGIIVGVPRNIFGLDLVHTFFSFTDYDGEPASIGFGSYTDSPYSSDLFLSYFDGATYTLTDFEMRYLIKLKIIYNNVFSSTEEIVSSLWELFGYSVTFVDNKDMTVDYFVVNPYQNVFIAAEFLDILPTPMGVGSNVTLESDLLYAEDGSVLLDENNYPLYQE